VSPDGLGGQRLDFSTPLILATKGGATFSFAITIDAYLRPTIGIYFEAKVRLHFRLFSRHIVGHPNMKERLQ